MSRRITGARGQLAGAAAEQSVLRHYLAAGHSELARNWRGEAGEIDLILARGEEVIFVEVKASRSFAAAATRLRPAQFARIQAAAEEFLATRPRGALTPMRIDLALVDAAGAVEVVENLGL
ncbi:YraN family protein [Poseidonocella sedimentorum]|uniref:UPF0102 protein SAMN04515673_10547 n=1 Tax=Poseidonocella sedimentorum TaxID=871652 RepID=A0A1I6DSJ6_9RHOB|nr:YraN family protein [Poseidonocella sedimentorum]SFR08347.1 putative endonuclease [Poseidonocella sedimentorum]